MENTTKLILTKEAEYFEIEKKLLEDFNYDKTKVIGILDCCRVLINPKEVYKSKNDCSHIKHTISSNLIICYRVSPY